MAFAIGKALGFATNLVLARLLTPDDFGLVSFAMILIGGLTVLQDLGVRSAVVYTERDARLVAGTALTINVLTAVLLFCVSVLLAPWLAGLGGNEAISPIVVVLGIGLVISSLDSVQRALLVKELAFRRKFLPDLIPLFASGILSISLAFLGFGAWSIVYGYLTKAIITTLLFWYVSDIRPLPGFRWTIAGELFKYGKHVSLASVVGFVGINADYFIVGLKLGTFDLGLYTLAFIISNLPCVAVGQVISTVMFPAYSRVRSDTRQLAQLFEDSFTLVCAVAIPAGIAIFVCGPAFIPVLFNDKWVGIKEPLQLLAIYGAARTIAMSFAPFYNAVGRPSIEWRINVARLALLIPLMLFSVRYGLIGIPISYLVAATIFIPLNGMVLTRTIGLPAQWLLRLSAPHVAGAVLAGLLLATTSVVPPLHAARNNPAGSILLAVLAISTYAVVAMCLNPRILALARMGTLAIPGARRWVAA
ncbi:MAG: lipopolysaccharide biosynthesis protein [Chloroflexota bacterium]|nr:lipopolysaccharide biosynthesis protein [Chloroflexota bacterium]